MDPHRLDLLLLIGSATVLLAVLAVRASVRIGLPSLLLYLLMGLLLGEDVLGIEFDDAGTAQALAFAALIVIVSEGGLTTRWSDLRPVAALGLALATVGVLVTAGIVAVVARLVLDLPWQSALLIGAVTAPTDAAAVFTVLRRVPLRPSVLGALEVESGLNDATAVLLVMLLTTSHPGADGGLLASAGLLVYELVGGLVIGAVIGRAGAALLRRVALPASGLYPIAALSITVLAYAVSVTGHASGFAAVYVTALVLGNSELPHRATTRSFAEGVAWLAQIGLFIMLGLLATPRTLTLEQAVGGGAVGVALTVLARPASVVLCAVPLRVPVREQAFLALAGLRGAVPIVLSTIPLAAGVPRASEIFNVVFVLVVVLTVLTSPALPRLASTLRVTQLRPYDLEVEAAPLERIAADLLQVLVTDRSRLHGVEVAELRLPAGASVSLVVRDGASFTPEGRTALRRGDEVLVVTPRRAREATERRLQAVSRGGRLASWTGEAGQG